MRAIVFVGVALAVVSVVGCGGKEAPGVDPTVPVKGKVSLDGKPLASGEISFAVEGKPPQIATITDGSYTGQAMVGENRVEISVYETGKDELTGDPTKVNKLPARFNTESTLKATVAESGANEFPFEVKSN